MIQDADGDFVPDRLGETVTVSGRATVGSGIIRATELYVFLQDGSGGLQLRGDHIPTPIVAGDSLIATGVLEQVHGMTRLVNPTYYVVPTPQRHIPEPHAIKLSTTALETYEGQLVELEGYVAGKGHVNSGSYLNVAVGDSTLFVFVYQANGTEVTFDDFHISDYVRITGLVGQYDWVAPYNMSYQIYPRSVADVVMAGIPPRMYRNILLGTSALLLAVLGWVYLLKREVRRRHRQLEASEVRYQLLFQQAGDALFVYPLQGELAHPFLEVNPVTCTRLGYPEEAMTSLSLKKLVAEDQQAVLADHLQQLRARGQSIDELALVTQDGTAIPFEISSHVFTLSGQATVLSVARDITQRKAYEEGLIAAKQEAEQLAALKSAFLANMSHEIRTPLAAIIGFSDILAEEVTGEGREFIGMIRDNGKRLLSTLDAILDLTRLDAKQLTLHPKQIDLVSEVKETIQLLAPLADQKNLRLHFASPHPALRAVQDSNGLHRIINNLVGNAIKFTERGEVQVSLTKHDTHARIAVKDTGIGIDAAFLPILFDEFKQESTGLTRNYEGNGLGLAITRRLVDMMGGEIHVASEKGRGSTFIIDLPLVTPGAQACALPNRSVETVS